MLHRSMSLRPQREKGVAVLDTRRGNSQTMALVRLKLSGAIGGAAIVALVCAAPARAECDVEPSVRNSSAFQILKSQPSRLFTLYPKGGGAAIVTVAALTADDPTFARIIAGQLGAATSDQKTAVGKGFASAYDLCRNSDAVNAARIVDIVIGIRIPEIQAAFQKSDATALPPPRPLPGRSSRPAVGSVNIMPAPETFGGASKLPDPFGPPEQWR